MIFACQTKIYAIKKFKFVPDKTQPFEYIYNTKPASIQFQQSSSEFTVSILPPKFNKDIFQNVEIIIYFQFTREESLRNSIATFAPLLSADIKYEFEGLAPLNLLSDMFIQYTQDFKYAYLVPWWSSLKNGNWKAIMAAIENIQANGVYDIYMGTSGNISYPNNNNDEVVQILSYSVRRMAKNE